MLSCYSPICLTIDNTTDPLLSVPNFVDNIDAFIVRSQSIFVLIRPEKNIFGSDQNKYGLPKVKVDISVADSAGLLSIVFLFSNSRLVISR